MKIMGRGADGLIKRNLASAESLWSRRDDDEKSDSIFHRRKDWLDKVFDFISGRGKPLRDPGYEWMDADITGIGTVIAWSPEELDYEIEKYIDSIPNCLHAYAKKNFSNEHWMMIPEAQQLWWADIHYHRNKK